MSAPASTPSYHATHRRTARRNGLSVRNGQESQSSLRLPGEVISLRVEKRAGAPSGQ